MSNPFPHSLQEYRIQAHILQKHLRSENADLALLAAMRLQQLPQLLHHTVDDILAAKTAVKRKHTLRVIAIEHGFDQWAEMKQAFEHYETIVPTETPPGTTLLYPPQCKGFINEWHVDYTLAVASLTYAGGYLLPYHEHFFICQAAYIDALGLDPADPDWAKIGWNWVEPADVAAHARLHKKLLAQSGGI